MHQETLEALGKQVLEMMNVGSDSKVTEDVGVSVAVVSAPSKRAMLNRMYAQSAAAHAGNECQAGSAAAGDPR